MAGAGGALLAAEAVRGGEEVVGLLALVTPRPRPKHAALVTTVYSVSALPVPPALEALHPGPGLPVQLLAELAPRGPAVTLAACNSAAK